MAIGYLTIQARTAHDALPLSGASIRIMNAQGASVYELTTDENGETQSVPLETLDKSFSLSPYYSGIPYTNYSVLARASGFNSLYVSDIPIYDGERAVLPISVIPMQERQRTPYRRKSMWALPPSHWQDRVPRKDHPVHPMSCVRLSSLIP